MNLIIDGNYLLHRVLKASSFEDIVTDTGLSTGGLYGCLQILRSILLDMVVIDRCIIVFDGGYSKRRLSIDQMYKINRVGRQKELLTEEQVAYKKIFFDQRLLCIDVLPKLSCKIVQLKDKEADDIIYWLTRNLEGKHVVLSDDKDLLQTINFDTSVFRPIADELITNDNFKVKTGFSLKNYVLARAIIGDKSDCISGINGLGKKTTQDILNHADTENNIVAYCNKQKHKRYKLIIGQFHKIRHNMRLLDLSLEEFTSNEVAMLINAVTIKLDFSQSDLYLTFCNLGFDLIVSDYSKWVTPFRRLR